MANPDNKTNLHKRLTFFMLLIITQLSYNLNVTNARSLTYIPQNDQDNNLVNYACSHTLYPDECTSTLNSDPRSQTSDLKGLASIALDKSLEQATRTMSMINDLMKSRKSSDNAYKSLDDCREEYSEAVDDLKDSQVAFDKDDYASVNELVSGAMTDCVSCLDDGPGNVKPDEHKDGKRSMLVEKNKYFYKMCSDVLAILKLLG